MSSIYEVEIKKALNWKFLKQNSLHRKTSIQCIILKANLCEGKLSSYDCLHNYIVNVNRVSDYDLV